MRVNAGVDERMRAQVHVRVLWFERKDLWLCVIGVDKLLDCHGHNSRQERDLRLG